MKAVIGIWFVVVAAALGGWIWNVVKLIGMNFDHLSGMMVARIIGIPLGPLGAVLGYF